MSKDQEEFKNELCDCIHIRDYHAGIDGHCYVERCMCKQFVPLRMVTLGTKPVVVVCLK